MYSDEAGPVDQGRLELTAVDLQNDETIPLDGYWEFYWNDLLPPESFVDGEAKEPLSFEKVPGSWNDKVKGRKKYPDHGVATYRLRFSYPSDISDPALSIKIISSAYKLYANGVFVNEVGKVSEDPDFFEPDYKQCIVPLPDGGGEMELVFQVANLNYFRGGMRDSVFFGSEKVLYQEKMYRTALQLLFIGLAFGVGIYYLMIYAFQRKQKTALYYGLICVLTAMHGCVWGETPYLILFPEFSLRWGLIVSYIVLYNLPLLLLLFVVNFYPGINNKKLLLAIVLPTLLFDILLFAPSGFRASFNIYFCLLELIQIIYIILILMKAVLRGRDHSKIMLLTIGLFLLTMVGDLFHYRAVSSVDLSYLFIFGNLLILLTMSYIQAETQSKANEQLISYNEKLLEADALRGKVRETEYAFLQAQIRPHFLYNALNTIVNVCERDGKKGSKLILDLAIYLQNSLEFNDLNKLATIKKELEFIDTYFRIEQARFGEKIQLKKEIHVDLDQTIPVFLLQPLVENAVRHGITKKIEGGTVTVKIERIEEGLCITVEDDGTGMDAEKLRGVFSEEEMHEGVGLRNIDERLHYLYGSGLKIITSFDEGTSVKITIPKKA